jgi:large subunit ribosomal protein L17
MNGKLTTTLAKAKELKSFSDSNISRAREANLSTRRKFFSLITKKEVAQKLFDETLTDLKDQKFGFTRVVKLGRRLSDGAERARVELVGEKNEDKNS